MKIGVAHTCADFNSYRAARVKSLFNVESGANFNLQADLDIDDGAWQIGVIVGPSGSGKSSIGQRLGEFYSPAWPADQPLIDAIAPEGSFDAVASALSAVGLGSVPAWLRPFQALSNGERFRASLARLICEAPPLAVVDEFSSVVDRQIAQVGAGAFAKAWRRTAGKVVLLSCHYDVLDWLEPDWVFDTTSGRFLRRCLWRRQRIELDIHQTDEHYWPAFEPHYYLRLNKMVAAEYFVASVQGQPVAHLAVSLLRRCLWRRQRIELDIHQTDEHYWPAFEPHYYLRLNKMVAAEYFVASVQGQPVAHLAVSPRPGLVEARISRLVVMPEWQGAGVGIRFLNAVCEDWKQGRNRYCKPLPMLFHTSHPLLAMSLRRDHRWTQVSAEPFGVRTGASGKYGGHFRSIQGFRYLGEP